MSAGQGETACYHCGLPVPPGTNFQIEIEGHLQQMCCAGCQAVAQAIVANGLTEYYRHRDALPENPRESLPAALQEAGLFDLPEIQRDFVRPVRGPEGQVSPHEREAALMLEGITCAACVWLNEAHLARQPGVSAVEINYATRRAVVRWDERQIRLSQILSAIAAIGYRAHPYDPALSEQLARKERREALWRLFVAGFGMMQVMMYAFPVYVAQAGEMTPDIEQLMRWASLILTLPVMLYSAAPFFRSGWRDLRQHRIGMDVPVALGVGCAFLASTWATVSGQGEVYFDSVTMFVFFLLAGRYFEMLARQRAARGVELIARAQPAFAWRLIGAEFGASALSLEVEKAEKPEKFERVAVSQLAVGDRLLVKPGETVPADGEVIEGESQVDESLLTGESRPQTRVSGDRLVGGSLNVVSPLVMKVLRLGEETRLAAIRRLVERAAAEKPKLVEMADRIAARFVVALIALAVLTAGVWWFVDASRMLWVFVAVLVVSCPCALSLATPAALTVATGAFSRLGVLVTRGHAIETLGRVDHFVFDKTGTLTLGRLALAQVLPLGAERDASRLLALAAALEEGSEHPVGWALCQAAQERASTWPNPVGQIRAVTGQGMSARLEGHEWRIGTPVFVQALHGQALPEFARQWQERAARAAGTVVALGDETGWLSLFHFNDVLREEAPALVAALKQAGVRLSILSGDAPEAVQAVAARLGIDEVLGGQSPEDKYAAVRRWQESGSVVAMIGDGVNDAPVLAQAQVSIAVGGSSDLARKSADIVLLGGNLMTLVRALSLARHSLRVIRQNLVWAFVYNLSAIPLAMLGVITPWMAGLGMSSSSLLVVLNALRLQGSTWMGKAEKV